MAIDYTGFGFPKTGVTPKKAKDARNRAGRTVAAADRSNVFQRQKYTCYASVVSPVCTHRVHHPHELIPVSKGGPRESWNRVGLCSSCHAATDSTLGGRRLFFEWTGKADGKKPNADKLGNVKAIWKDRRTRKTAPGPSTGVLPQDDGAGRPITQPGQVAPVEVFDRREKPMKCISLKQPHATLVALGEKVIETRIMPWRILQTCGWFAVHASSTWTRTQAELLDTEPFRAALARQGITRGNATHQDLPRGAITAVARCTEMFSTDRADRVLGLSDEERAFGDYGPNRWAYVLDHRVFKLHTPVMLTGRLGVYDLTPAVELHVLLQIQDYKDLPAELIVQQGIDTGAAGGDQAVTRG